MTASSYDKGHVPVVIEDRTIFHPPDIHAQRVGGGGGPSKVVTRQSPFAIVIAVLALAGCAGLTYLLMQQQSDTTGAQITTLRTKIATLETDNKSFQTIGAMLDQSRSLEANIAAALNASELQNYDSEKYREINDRTKLEDVDWLTPATSVLTTHNAELTKHKTFLELWQAPQPVIEESTNPDNAR